MWTVGALLACALVGAACSAVVAAALAPRRARARLRARARIRYDLANAAPVHLEPGEPLAVQVHVADDAAPAWAGVVAAVVALACGAAVGLVAPFGLVGSVAVGVAGAVVAYVAGFAAHVLLTRGPSGGRWYAEVLEDHDVVRERRRRREDGNEEGPRPA